MVRRIDDSPVVTNDGPKFSNLLNLFESVRLFGLFWSLKLGIGIGDGT